MGRECPATANEVCKQVFVNSEQATDRRERDIEATDVSRAEIAEAQIATFIARRARQNGEERPEEEAWQASVRAYNASREAERRVAWSDYHRGQAERLRRSMMALVELHEGKARQLSSEIEGRESA